MSDQPRLVLHMSTEPSEETPLVAPTMNFDPDQERDESGKWTSGGGGGGENTPAESDDDKAKRLSAESIRMEKEAKALLGKGERFKGEDMAKQAMKLAFDAQLARSASQKAAAIKLVGGPKTFEAMGKADKAYQDLLNTRMVSGRPEKKLSAYVKAMKSWADEVAKAEKSGKAIPAEPKYPTGGRSKARFSMYD